MDFYRGQAKLLRNFRITNFARFINGAAFNPLGEQGTGSNCRATSVGFELGVFNYTRGIYLDLQALDVTASGSTHHACSHVIVFVIKLADIAWILVVIKNLV